MVTTIGIFLIPVILLALMTKPSAVVYIAAVVVPFTATSVFNMPSGVPITAFQMVAAFSIIFWFVWLLMGNGRVRLKLSQSETIFLLFFLTIVFSSGMPLLIDGSLVISSNSLNDVSYQRLTFNFSRLKSLFPVVIGFAFTLMLASYLNSDDKIKKFIKFYLGSIFFVAVWGLLQFSFQNILGIEYPHYIFNNSEPETMRGYSQMIEIGGREWYRISSVTHEPSIFSKTLLPALALLFVCRAMGSSVFNRSVDVVLIAIIFAVLILSTSTIGYVGMILIVGLVFFTKIASVRFRTRVAIFFGCLCAFGVASISVVGQAFFTEIVLEKTQTGSFLERILSIETSFGYFTEYPVLGVGWANVTSHDLIMNLLVNTGVIGFGLFALFVGVLATRSGSILSLTTATKNKVAVHSGSLIAFLVLIMCGVVSGLEFYTGTFYMFTGILFALQRSHYGYRLRQTE